MTSAENTGSISKETIIKMLTKEIDELKHERKIQDIRLSSDAQVIEQQTQIIEKLQAAAKDHADDWKRIQDAEREVEKLKEANVRETCYAADLKIELSTLHDNLRRLVKPT